MNTIAISCGSNMGSSPAYAEAAAALGREMARRGLTLVYGGTPMGLTGVLADTALDAGGTVVGIIHRRLHPAALLDALARWKAPTVDTWIAPPGN